MLISKNKLMGNKNEKIEYWKLEKKQENLSKKK